MDISARCWSAGPIGVTASKQQECPPRLGMGVAGS